MHDGGEDKECNRIFVWPARIEVNLLKVACPNEAGPVGNTSAFDGGLVSMRLSDRPGGHLSACTPTENSQATRISPALLDGIVCRAVYIAIGAIAKMLVDRI